MSAALRLDDVTVTVLDKPLAFDVRDVAKMARISPRRLLDHCRRGVIDHIHEGNARVMTEAQIAAMLAHFSTGAVKPKPAPVDPLEQAREASRRAASRQRPRRTA